MSCTGATALRNSLHDIVGLLAVAPWALSLMNRRPMLLPAVPPKPWPALDIMACDTRVLLHDPGDLLFHAVELVEGDAFRRLGVGQH